MKIPPLLLGATLLVWGWRLDTLAFAVPIALVVEGASRVPWRWRLRDSDFNRVADLSAVGFVILAVYQFDAHSVRGIYSILGWLPAVLFLLVAVQLYSTRERTSYTVLFLSVRRAVARGTLTNPGAVDLSKPYLVVCLVSAGAVPSRDASFYVCACLVLGWLLWVNRPQRYVRAIWLPVAFAGALLGYLNVQGVLELRRVLAPLVMEYFQSRMWAYRDPYKAYTAMGYIGRLKASDRIVLRVRPSERWGSPALLREASYQTYSRTLWLAGKADFGVLAPDAEGTTWPIDQGRGSVRRITVSKYMPRGKGLLPVPTGTFMVDELPVEDVYRNSLGVLKVLKGPELVEYRTHYTPERSYLAPPSPSDLGIPRDVTELIGEVADKLELYARDPAEVLARLERHFFDNFRYSVTLFKPKVEGTPLHDFLLASRSGHCEFFASATVLLLRAAGIPARYATGYSVQEWSELERAYLVRRRHAHSWALAYVDGRWVDFDTTPAQWGELEAAQAPWWQSTYDVMSWLRVLYARWRWGGSEDESNTDLLWLILPLGTILAWRLYVTERVARDAGPRQSSETGAKPGLDSELYALERRLSELGLVRARGEALQSWFRRLERDGQLPEAALVRHGILPVHYRYRFDPQGIDVAERESLRENVSKWLSAYAAGGP